IDGTPVGDVAGFTLNGTTLEVDDTVAAGTYAVAVFASDGTLASTTPVSFDVTVSNPVDVAPTVELTNPVTEIPEDQDLTTSFKVADITITDDGLSTVTPTLSGADAALFEIVNNAGALELHLQAGAALDFETNPQLDVTVEASDAAGTGTATFSAPVTDINEAPTITGTVANESTTAGTATSIDLSGLVLDDPDAGDIPVLAVEIDGTPVGDVAGFTLNGTTLEVDDTVASGTTYTVQVFASDGALTSTTPVSFDVTVGADATITPPVTDGVTGTDTDDVFTLAPATEEFTFTRFVASAGNDTYNFTNTSPTAYSDVFYGSLASNGIVASIDLNSAVNTVDKGADGIDTLVDLQNATSAWGFGIWGTSGNDFFNIVQHASNGGFLAVAYSGGDDTINLTGGTGTIRLDFGDTSADVNIDLSSITSAPSSTTITLSNLDTVTLNANGITGSMRFSLETGSGNDTVVGTNNSDTIILGAGTDTADGGGDFDNVRYDRFDVQTGISLNSQTVTGIWAGLGFTHTLSNIEFLQATDFVDLLTLDGSLDVNAGGGNDQISIVGNFVFQFVETGTGSDTINLDAISSGEVELFYGGLPGGDTITVNVDTAANTATVEKGATDTDTITSINSLGINSLRFVGTSGNDVFNISTDDPDQEFRIRSGEGSDTFNLSGPADFDLELDRDTDFNEANQGANVNLTLASGQIINDGFGFTDTILNGSFRDIRLTEFGDIFIGDALDNRVRGFGGNDFIALGDGVEFQSVGPGTGDDDIDLIGVLNGTVQIYYGDLDQAIDVVVNLNTNIGEVFKGTNGRDDLFNTVDPALSARLEFTGTAFDDTFTVIGDALLNAEDARISIRAGQGNDTIDFQSPGRLDLQFFRGAEFDDLPTQGVVIDLGLASNQIINDGFGYTDSIINGTVNFVDLTDLGDIFTGTTGNEALRLNGGADTVTYNGGWDYIADLNVAEDTLILAGDAFSEIGWLRFDQRISSEGNIQIQLQYRIDGADDFGIDLENLTLAEVYQIVRDQGFAAVNFVGGSGDDVGLGTPENDSIDLGTNIRGNDQVLASLGDDTIIYSNTGEESFNTLDYSTLGPIGITANLNFLAGTGTVFKSIAGTDTLVDLDAAQNFEGFEIQGTGGDDTFNITKDASRFGWIGVSWAGGNDTINFTTGGDGNFRVYAESEKNVVADLQTGDINIGLDESINLNISGNTDFLTLDLYTGEGDDTVFGNNLDNRFRSRGGDDFFDGRDGFDRIRYNRDEVTGLNVNLLTGVATGFYNGEFFTQTLVSIEGIDGSNNDDILVGTNGGTYIDGRDGADTITGGDGDDELRGRGGNDIIEGGAGTDSINGGSGDDIITPGSGIDFQFVNSFTGNDTINLTGVNSGITLWYGDIGGGVDVSFDLGANTATVDKGPVDGFDTIQQVAGALVNGGIIITGSNGDDTFALSIDDINAWTMVQPGGGDDSINHTGQGFFHLDLYSDPFGNLAGPIAIDLTFGTGQIIDDGLGGTDTLLGNTPDYITLSDFSDSVLGSLGPESIIGFDGDDVLNGGGGSDYLEGGDGNDTLIATSAGATADAGNDDDTIHRSDVQQGTTSGGSGRDTLLLVQDTTDLFDFSLITVSNTYSGIEVLSLENGDTDTLTLTVQNIIDFSDTADPILEAAFGTLADESISITADAGDTVRLLGTGIVKETDTVSDGTTTFDVYRYTSGLEGMIAIEQGVNLETPDQPLPT
ncbi:beta strand repeat-containing protein, partial [Ovoidimarina sediminis]|uniref:beta strand repeat-containing protein n=1 Tax=Ovoidimarina sediminis TaxID=3079856 RepID=UPI002909C66C|nr:hypothetical protein [Rhodophyticola sp. MJ-SS7]